MAKNSIYLDLDALFDTRFSLLHRFDEETAVQFLSSGYRDRITDEFWRVSKKFTEADWVDAWAKRDWTLLPGAPITSIPSFLIEAIESIDWDAISPNDPERKVKITINTHPYQLEKEVKDSIVYHLGLLLPTVDDIDTICIPPNFLTNHQLLGRYDLVVMYNFHEWVATYAERFEEFEFRNLLFAVPKLFKKLPEEGSEDLKLLASFNAFSAQEYMLFGRCELRMIPVADFSAP